MRFAREFQPTTGKPRILFTINTPLFGGAEQHTFNLSRDLNALGFDTSVFAMKPGPINRIDGSELIAPLRDDGLRRRIADLANLLRREPHDLVVGVNERPLLGAYFARLDLERKIPVIGLQHSTSPRNWREKLLLAPHILLFNLVDAMIFISRNQYECWRRRGMCNRHSSIIANGVDTERYSPAVRGGLRASARAELKFEPEDYVVGHCAMFRPEKNQTQLIEAIGALRRRGLPAKALLIGDGPMRAKIEACVAGLGLSDFIAMPGATTDVRPLLAASDVGVNCSVETETLSLASLEVMAMGLPMVMSGVGGALEILHDASGRIFPVGDTAALTEALQLYHNADGREAAGNAARARIEALFDQRAMVSAYSDLFAKWARPDFRPLAWGERQLKPNSG